MAADMIAAVPKIESHRALGECPLTSDAVRRYGELDLARTAAALHLTC